MNQGGEKIPSAQVPRSAENDQHKRLDLLLGGADITGVQVRAIKVKLVLVRHHQVLLSWQIHYPVSFT
jgi:hypothetical protein